MALAYSQFGVKDPVLYAAYLSTIFYGVGGDDLVARSRVFDSFLGGVGFTGSSGIESGVSTFDVEAIRSFRTLCFDNARADGGCGVTAGHVIEGGGSGVVDGLGGSCVVERIVERDANSVSSSGFERNDCESDRGVARGEQSSRVATGSVAGADCKVGVVGSDCVLRGPKGGLSEGRGPNYARNCIRRERRNRKDVTERTSLQVSLEAKWEVENRLAVKQAERKIALLEARDLESEKRMQRAQIMRTTEAAKVQTERAYASLKRTGNVPGFAETVVTDGSCPALSPSRSDGTCISPDSSVSQQEIRAMMKELEDYKLTLSRIERDNPALVAHHMEGHGVKTAFTLDSDGMCPVDEPGCMGIDGKYHLDSYERNPKFYKDRFRAEEATERYFNRE